MKLALKSLMAVMLAGFPFLQGSLYAAGNTGDAGNYRVRSESLTITEINTGKESVPAHPPLLNPGAGQDKVVGELINAGVAAWSVVSGGSPSADATASYASALPPGWAMPWSSVAGWKGPREYSCFYHVINDFGQEVIKTTFTISYYYGGTEGNSGRPGDTEVSGRYITNLTVKAPAVSVYWGWHFYLSANISNPMNIGTPKNPVAFMRLDLKWSQSNFFSAKSGVWTFEIDGNGKFRDLDAETKNLTEKIGPIEKPESAVSWN